MSNAAADVVACAGEDVLVDVAAERGVSSPGTRVGNKRVAKQPSAKPAAK